MYLENINSPQDVKKLDFAQLEVLAAEMREALLKRLSVHGGHFGPNMGFVEATVALLMCLIHPRIKSCLMFRTNAIRIKCSPAERTLIWIPQNMMM